MERNKGGNERKGARDRATAVSGLAGAAHRCDVQLSLQLGPEHEETHPRETTLFKNQDAGIKMGGLLSAVFPGYNLP